jgi:hypothetical protein
MAYLLNQRGKYNKIYISVKKILFKFPQHMQYQKYPKVSNWSNMSRSGPIKHSAIDVEALPQEPRSLQNLTIPLDLDAMLRLSAA